MTATPPTFHPLEVTDVEDDRVVREPDREPAAGIVEAEVPDPFRAEAPQLPLRPELREPVLDGCAGACAIWYSPGAGRVMCSKPRSRSSW